MIQPWENQRTNNYIIREEGPKGYRSVCSAIFRHIGNNYGEEFFFLKQETMTGDLKHLRPSKIFLSSNDL